MPFLVGAVVILVMIALVIIVVVIIVVVVRRMAVVIAATVSMRMTVMMRVSLPDCVSAIRQRAECECTRREIMTIAAACRARTPRGAMADRQVQRRSKPRCQRAERRNAKHRGKFLQFAHHH